MHIMFWLVAVSILSVGAAPLVLMIYYEKKAVIELFRSGLKSEGKIVGYEIRGHGKARTTWLIFEFTPIGQKSPIKFSKAGYTGFEKKYPVGYKVMVFYHEKFSTMSVIDVCGNGQSLESQLEKLNT